MSGLRYKDKVTIVTGGVRGIGRGIAELFVKEGSKVVICSNVETEGREAEQSLNTLGPGQAVFVFCDLTKEEDIKRLIDTTVTTHGRIDCLINNAGAHPLHIPIDEIRSEDFRSLLEINLMAHFHTCKHALPHLRKTRGNVINVSSLVAHIGETFSVSYAATKGAVEAMSKSLAIDEAKYGVRVNVLIPGNVWTPMWESMAHTFPDPAAEIQAGKQAQLMGRFGTAEEMGKACMFLAADATFSTGTSTVVSGGAELNFSKKSVVPREPQ